MKIEKRDGTVERRILIGMVTNDAVIGRIGPKWKEQGLFSAKWANIVGEWCVNHWTKFKEAPGAALQSLFDEWASQEKQDRDTIKAVEKFLDVLSTESDQQGKINSEHLLDLAGKQFNKVAMERLAEEIDSLAKAGKADEALAKVAKSSRVELGTGSYVNIQRDMAVIDQIYKNRSDSLVKYPGALGHFFGTAFQRDSFVAVEAAEKKGKSYLLLDLAWRAIHQGRKVAYFEVGDMSLTQVGQRFLVRAARRPMLPCTILYPTEIIHEPDTKFADVTQKELVFKKGLPKEKGKKALEKSCETSGDGYLLRTSCHSNSTINVDGIRAILDEWDQGGWLPDLVLIDYADILAPPRQYFKESRDAVNHTWKQLRALSQDLHALVVTATQADADSYDAELISMKNFSEDKRKHGHVTGIFAINMTDAEKRLGLMRLNWVVLREADFDIGKCVHVAGCRALANPCILSTF